MNFPETNPRHGGLFSPATTSQKRVKGDMALAFALLILGAELLLGLYALLFDDDNFQQKVLAYIMLTISFFPMWYYLRSPVKRLSLIPFVSIIYGIYYALPVLLPFDVYLRFQGFSNDESVQALLLSTLGLLSMLATFYLMPTNIWKKYVPCFGKVKWSDVKARRAALMMGVFGLGLKYVSSSLDIPASIQQLLYFFIQLPALSIAILFYLQLSRRLPAAYIALLWGVFLPLQLAIDISSGFLSGLFRDFALLLMIYFAVKKRVPWLMILVFSAVSIPLLLAKQDFRTDTWKGNNTSNPLEKASVYASAARSSTSASDNSDHAYASMRRTVNRIDIHAVFAHVLSFTPRYVPYWGGESYTPLLSRLIPRALWPDKPSEEMGQVFGHRYNILDAQDTHTSINTPQLVEFYMNFGLFGVLFGMAFIGLIYHMLQYVLDAGADGGWTLVSGAVIYSPLLNVESNFSLVFGNILIWILFLMLLGYCIFGFPRRARRKLKTRQPFMSNPAVNGEMPR